MIESSSHAEHNPLLSPAQFAPGVGPQRAELLKKLGIHTIQDILLNIPRDILDYTNISSIHELDDQDVHTVRGEIVDIDFKSGRRPLVYALVRSEGQHVRLVWFNQPWMFKRLNLNAWGLFTGKCKKNMQRWEFSHPRIQWIDGDDDPRTVGLLPRYHLTEGLRMEDMRRLSKAATEEYAHLLTERYPEIFLRESKLLTINEAIKNLHAPESMKLYEQATRRIVYDDLFEFQTGLALRRRLLSNSGAAPKIEVTAKIDARIRRLFPFSFTPAQDAAIKEIAQDLNSTQAMHRLLQADVGAGKTVIAFYAMLAAVAAGYQAILLAPTEILVRQHWENIQELLKESRVSRALLTGSLTNRERLDALEKIKSGEHQLIVGTQALLQDKVQFHNPGVVIIDEQHKFGVMQRAKFTESGHNPHMLVMTATPIPRSLCLTQYGDLDLTIMQGLPPGRQPVHTSRILSPQLETKAWDFIRKQLQAGRQLFCVSPRIESNAGNASRTNSPDNLPLNLEEGRGEGSIPTAETRSQSKSMVGVEQLFKQLQQQQLAGFKLGLLHGQLDQAQQERVMEQFREGEIQALIATTVIEVGVDIPNASLICIFHAERFGLAQLHQLRGRVGRGAFKGYCFLFCTDATEEAKERLKILEDSPSGFDVAEADFKLRGPGDILGTRQSGELPLNNADLIRDEALVKETHLTAQKLINSGQIDSPEFLPLKLKVMERFAKLFDLTRTG